MSLAKQYTSFHVPAHSEQRDHSELQFRIKFLHKLKKKICACIAHLHDRKHVAVYRQYMKVMEEVVNAKLSNTHVNFSIPWVWGARILDAFCQKCGIGVTWNGEVFNV